MKSNIPHCPNQKCPNCNNPPRDSKWFRKRGIDRLKYRGHLQRYQCKSCKRTFTDSYFSMDYYCNYSLSYEMIISRLCSNRGIREIGRGFHCDPKTILNRISRLSKQISGVTAGKERKEKERIAIQEIDNFVLSKHFSTKIYLLTEYKSKKIILINSTCKPNNSFLHCNSKKIKSAKFEYNSYTEIQKEIKNAVKLYGICNFSVSITNLFPKGILEIDLAEHSKQKSHFAKNRNNSMERHRVFQFYNNYIKGVLNSNIGKRVLHEVFKGKRLQLDEVKKYLWPSQVKLWERKILNPLNVRAV